MKPSSVALKMQAACPDRLLFSLEPSPGDRLCKIAERTGSLEAPPLGPWDVKSQVQKTVIITRDHGEGNWEAEHPSCSGFTGFTVWLCLSSHGCSSVIVHIYFLLVCPQRKWRAPEYDFSLSLKMHWKAHFSRFNILNSCHLSSYVLIAHSFVVCLWTLFKAFINLPIKNKTR